MKIITTRLKRYKFTWYVVTIPFIPILIILGVIWHIGELAEIIANEIANFRTNIVYKIADKFKFEEEAQRQHDIDPDKFKL